MRLLPADDVLVLEMEGIERLWALCNRVIVRRTDITDVRFESEFNNWVRPEFRLPGTALPGVLVAGSFKTADGWDFLYLRRPRGYWRTMVAFNVMVIETNQKRYQRIIVSSNPDIVGQVINWWQDTTRPD